MIKKSQLVLSMATVCSLILLKPVFAQSCTEEQIIVDLDRSNIYQNYSGLPRFFPPSPLVPPSFSGFGTNQPLLELPSNPLQNLPHYSYSNSSDLEGMAKERLINCGDQALETLTKLLYSQTVDNNIRSSLISFLPALTSDNSQLVNIYSIIVENNNENRLLRLNALNALARLEDIDLNTLLLPLLHKDKVLGEETISYFEKADSNLDQTITALISILNFEDQTANPYSPYYASIVLGEIGADYPSVKDELKNIIEMEDVPISFRIHAASALGKLEPQSATSISLLQSIVEDSSYERNTRLDASLVLISVHPTSISSFTYFREHLTDLDNYYSYNKTSIEETFDIWIFSMEGMLGELSSESKEELATVVSEILEELGGTDKNTVSPVTAESSENENYTLKDSTNRNLQALLKNLRR